MEVPCGRLGQIDQPNNGFPPRLFGRRRNFTNRRLNKNRTAHFRSTRLYANASATSRYDVRRLS